MLAAPTKHRLWLVEVSEPRANDLCVTLVEAKIGTEDVDTELGSGYPVQPDNESRVFRVLWSHYVAFCVTNESYALPQNGTPLGCGLGRIESSAFREYVATSTFATDDYPGPLTHWFLNTEWHCFDVITAQDPEIQEVDALEAASIVSR